MRFVLIVVIMVVAIGEVMADTSREDKIAYIVETEDFRGQIIAQKEELIKGSIMKVSANPDIEVDQRTKDIISEELSNIIEELIDDYIKDIVYAHSKHLTDDEINALYNFYRSPEGISLGSKMPQVSRELFWIDKRYLELVSERAVSRITERLSQEGYN